MKTWFALAVYALVLLGLPASGQTVFKCTDEKGRPVFTQQPCADDAEVIDTSAALKTGSGGHVQGVSDYAKLGQLRHECQQQAAAISNGFAARRSTINAEIRVTRYNISRAANNRAGASWSAGLESKLGSLMVALEESRSDERRALAEHRDQCREKEQAEKDRQDERDRAAAEAAASEGGG